MKIEVTIEIRNDKDEKWSEARIAEKFALESKSVNATNIAQLCGDLVISAITRAGEKEKPEVEVPPFTATPVDAKP